MSDENNELEALRSGIVRERVARLAAERGLNADQAQDIHARVIQAARLRAVAPHSDLGTVDLLFDTVEADPSAAHLFQRVRSIAPETARPTELGKLSPTEYRRVREASKRR